MAKLIAFEGIDGSGKSTQVRLLAERMKRGGYPCDTTMEPTDGPVGSLIHQILTGRMKADHRVMVSLFAADRLDHLLNETDGIVQKLECGVHVVTDRYYFSSFAYQSVEDPLKEVIRANEQSRALAPAALTVFLDIEPAAALERIAKNRFGRELYEKEERLQRVRHNYLEVMELLKAEEHCVVLDGNRDEKTIAADVWNFVKPML